MMVEVEAEAMEHIVENPIIALNVMDVPLIAVQITVQVIIIITIDHAQMDFVSVQHRIIAQMAVMIMVVYNVYVNT